MYTLTIIMFVCVASKYCHHVDAPQPLSKNCVHFKKSIAEDQFGLVRAMLPSVRILGPR